MNQSNFSAENEAGMNSAEDKVKQEQQQQEMKNSLLSQILDQNARARLNTLAMTKPEIVQSVEGMLINMARSGKLMGKVTEDQLKDLLAKVSTQVTKKTTVKFDRRRAAIDSDDDY